MTTRPRRAPRLPAPHAAPAGRSASLFAAASLTFDPELCDGGPSPCGQYVRRPAAAYARQYWNSIGCYEWATNGDHHCTASAGTEADHQFRNTDYDYYGNDCTNFASQVLHFGGMRFERTAPGINDPRHSDAYYFNGSGEWWANRELISQSPWSRSL